MNNLIDRDCLCDRFECDCTYRGDYVREKIMTAPVVNGWIPVEDALPDKLAEVLCVTEVGYVAFLWYNPKHKLFNVYDGDVQNAIEVTHWMYAPEPPQED